MTRITPNLHHLLYSLLSQLSMNIIITNDVKLIYLRKNSNGDSYHANNENMHFPADLYDWKMIMKSVAIPGLFVLIYLFLIYTETTYTYNYQYSMFLTTFYLHNEYRCMHIKYLHFVFKHHLSPFTVRTPVSCVVRHGHQGSSSSSTSKYF